MQRRKGFTLNEAIIALVLFSIILGFFATVYIAAYKTTRRSKSDINLSFKGQDVIEQGLANLTGEAQRWTEYTIQSKSDPSLTKPDDLQEPDVKINLWGGEVNGYTFSHTIKPENPGEKGLTTDIFGFVYVNTRRPLIANVGFKHATNAVPKIIYLNKFSDPKNYLYTVKVNNGDVLLRAVEREYLGKKSYSFDGKEYVSRPYSARKTTGELDFTPVYASIFPEAYNIISTPTGKIVFRQSSLSSYEANADVDMSSVKKEDLFSDVALLKTIQAQSINGFVSDEVVIPYGVTWIVGLPLTDNLIGHWDSNLIFSSITNESAEQYYADQILADADLRNLLSIARHEAKSTLVKNGDPILSVLQPSGEYRRFSSGIALPYSDREKNRLKITPNISLGTPLTIIIRAKQLDPSGVSPLFSFNMGNDARVKSNTSIGQQFYLSENATRIGYTIDRGVTITDPTRRFTNFPADFQSDFVYNSLSSAEERAGYAIYELKLVPNSTGVPMEYTASLLVNGKESYNLMLNSYAPFDLQGNGIELGSNLEISDILVYNKTLDSVESKTIAQYLLNKYTVSDDERTSIESQLR